MLEELASERGAAEERRSKIIQVVQQHVLDAKIIDNST